MKVNITAEAEASLREYNYRETRRGMRRRASNADGTFTIDLDMDTVDRLSEQMLAGETISDAIMRLTGDKAGLQ